MEDWKTNIKDWTKVSEKAASLMLQQSDAALKETVDTSNKISIRADRLLSIVLPMSTAIIIYLFTGNYSSFLFTTSVFCLIIIGVSFCYTIKNFRRYKVYTQGDMPDKIVVNECVEGYNEKEQYIIIALNTCENIQRKINENERINKTRLRHNDIALMSLMFLPVCPIASIIIIHLPCLF